MRRTPRTGPLPGRRLAGSLVAAAVAAVAIATATARAMPALVPSLSEHAVIAVVVAEVYLCVALTLIVANGRTRRDREETLALRRPAPRALLLGAAAWLGAYAVAAAVYLLGAPLGMSLPALVDVLLGVGADGGRLAGASVALTLVILVRVCLLVPIAEELLFRGALYTWLRSRLPAPWTIGITAVGFGLMHRLPAFVPLAVLVGVAAGWIREKTGSASVPILVHATQNVLVVVVSLLATGWGARLPMG